MITALPSLDRTSPTFKAEADAFFAAALPTFSVEAEAARIAINAADASTAAAAATATLLANAAMAAANFKGDWATLSGALARPASVRHSGFFWMLLDDLANVAASTPGVSANWAALPGAGNFNGSEVLLGPTTLDVTYCGKHILLGGGSSYSVLLPALSSVQAGCVLPFFASNPGLVTVTRSGADVILLNSVSAPSLDLAQGDTLCLVAYPGLGWVAASGTAQLAYSSTFGGSRLPNGYQRLPGGLIECRGTFVASATPGAAVPVNFPFAFSRCDQIVITPDTAGTSVAAAWYDSKSTNGFNGHANLASLVCSYIAKGI